MYREGKRLVFLKAGMEYESPIRACLFDVVSNSVGCDVDVNVVVV
jgi:hypothetical protein